MEHGTWEEVTDMSNLDDDKAEQFLGFVRLIARLQPPEKAEDAVATLNRLIEDARQLMEFGYRVGEV